MYIIVNARDNRIVATSIRPVSEKECSKNGQKVYQIRDEDFDESMMGAILQEYDEGQK